MSQAETILAKPCWLDAYDLGARQISILWKYERALSLIMFVVRRHFFLAYMWVKHISKFHKNVTHSPHHAYNYCFWINVCIIDV